MYSSADSYSGGARRIGPFRPFAETGALSVVVGGIPRWLPSAVDRFLALDILRGGNLTAWLEGGHEPTGRRSSGIQGTWHTTMILEIPPQPLHFAELDKAALRFERVLDEAAVLVAGSAAAHVIGRRELRGIFLGRSDGK